MEKKLTDEEIVKALEICVKDKGCGKCPYKLKDIDCGIGQRSENDYLKLIHRLQEDYSKLKKRYIKVLDLNEKVIAKQTAEIERLTKEKIESAKTAVEVLEQNIELQKQVDELREENTELYKEHTALIAGSILRKKQVQKDTAKEILDELFETKFKIGNDYVIYADNIKVFAERYGVSYEEND